MTNIIEVQKEINTQLANPQVLNSLVTTTFKGLAPQNVKKAILEGMLRGFKFDDFLKKNVYAVPFRENYSLVTSIDYARKLGMRGGIVGTSAPVYEERDGKIISCTVTVKRKVEDYVGEYSATAFMDEYSTGRNLWVTKPRTMIAKVAEAHALRKACPEELSQAYVEEEMQSQDNVVMKDVSSDIISKVENAKSIEELKKIYQENSGLGKDFAKLVTEKKASLLKK